jgi:hypothetical protein
VSYSNTVYLTVGGAGGAGGVVRSETDICVDTLTQRRKTLQDNLAKVPQWREELQRIDAMLAADSKTKKPAKKAKS